MSNAPTPIATPKSRGLLACENARALKGRGARSARSGRHEHQQREIVDDGWGTIAELAQERLPTRIQEEQARTIITRNTSPDICFDRSVNPYRGCEHGCIYCYARPTHAWLGLSPGLDFETRISAKVNAPQLFARELRHPAWKPAPIAIAPNTDAYQPAEKRYRLTRRLLEVAEEFGQPVSIITKSALVQRDIDILARLAKRDLVRVAISITTLDAALARIMEPRAATPAKRLETIGALADAGVPVAVMVAPVIPALTDHEIETILSRAAGAGARQAGYVMLRLPAEVSGLFREWLVDHFPERAVRIMSLVRGMQGGRDYDPRFGRRLVGSGPYAWAIGRRFEKAARRLGLMKRQMKMALHHFRPPARTGEQLTLPGLLEEREEDERA
ncbi:PA0069 family radical SAM protein [Thermopetrobacter sp. TC1]|uniref:PA0069 family radical SAM protein n=1 Tax=Thermopetrobacter sp. TC1 TaxID=1495045 RepID=UPI00068A1A03|nr:PA0069 family radical SAM protein [Thermopetrobacter sp. TC1]